MSELKGWSIARNDFPVAWQLPWKTGRFYHHPFTSGFGANAPNTAILYCAPIYVPNFEGVTVTSLGVEVTIAVTGSVTRIAMYEYESEARVGRLIVDSGQISTSSTGHRTGSISQFVHQGWYYLMFCTTGGGSTIRTISSVAPAFIRGSPSPMDVLSSSNCFLYSWIAGSITSIINNGYPNSLPLDPANTQVTNVLARVLVGI